MLHPSPKKIVSKCASGTQLQGSEKVRMQLDLLGVISAIKNYRNINMLDTQLHLAKRTALFLNTIKRFTIPCQVI